MQERQNGGQDDQLTTSASNESKGAERKENVNSETTQSKPPKYDASLVKALHATFFWRWWGAGALKFLSGTYRTLPLQMDAK